MELKAMNLAIVGVFAFLVAFSSAQFTEADLTVEAGDLGKIVGRNTTTTPESAGGARKPYIQFLGIPYADVTLRFQPSTMLTGPLNGSGDTFYASTAGAQCFQPSSFPIIMAEDCLSINVYTPRKYTGNDDDLLPVIFFIHGGAFTVGSGSSFSAIRIENRDVVYVTFNYRLGLSGFFSLQNSDLPGNAALYDMVNALKWTSRYIKYFGGNPDLVTIAGQSAGSCAVTHLVASPMAKGLFHRAIGHSGSALNTWGTTSDPMPSSASIAQKAGCYDPFATPVMDKAAVARCMRTVPMEKLVTTLYEYQVSERNQGRLGFGAVSPVIQDFAMAPYSPFMPENPENIYARGEQANVPLLMGVARHDGSYVLGVYYNRFLKDNNITNNATFMRTQLVPSILSALEIEDKPAGLYDSLTDAYLGESRVSGDFFKMYPGLVDLFSTFFFKAASFKTATLHSQLNDTYWFSFDYKGEATFWNQLFGAEMPPFPGGVTHTDDLIYLYLLTFLPFSESDYALTTRMLDYWADFARTGNPTPPGSPHVTWPLLDPVEQNFMAIDTQSYTDVLYSHTYIGPGWETTMAPAATTTSIRPPIRVTSTAGPNITETGPVEGGNSSTDIKTSSTDSSADANGRSPWKYLNLAVTSLLLASSSLRY